MSTELIDGPYVFNDQVFYVNAEREVISQPYHPNEPLLVPVANQESDQFHVIVGEDPSYQKPEYTLPDKLLALSDIEGNFNGLYSILRSHQVMNEQYEWTFGNGHLLLVGDMMDKGQHVMGVLWLIYHLEQQAMRYGGKVHFLLGNHELMNVQGNINYVPDKYLRVAQHITGEYNWELAQQRLYGPGTLFGQWLHTRNVAEKMGDYLFVHAGISPDVGQLNISIDQLNMLMQENLSQNVFFQASADYCVNTLLGGNGPVWYRGYALDSSRYPMAHEESLNAVLEAYGASRMIIGHTPGKDVRTSYHDRIVNINIVHSHEKYSGRTKGLLIEGGTFYKIDDLGNRYSL